MADKKKKPNRFVTNHPPVDPNDPAILITAGLIGRQNAPAEPQDAQKEEATVVTPAEPETQQEAKEALVSEPVTKPTAEERSEEEKVEEQPAKTRKNLLDSLDIEDEKAGFATRGFYIEDEVYEAIVKASKKKKISKSKIVNKLLRQAIFGE